MGDMNARINARRTKEEERIIGKFPFDAARVAIRTEQSPAVLENRHQLLDFCQSNDMLLMNTWFEKPDCKLATYRDEKRKDPSYWIPIRPDFEQLDFWISPRRWKNHIKNCEADILPNIDTDHRPGIATYQYKLRYVPKTDQAQSRVKYKQMSQQLWGKYNDTLSKILKQTERMEYNAAVETFHIYVDGSAEPDKDAG